MAPPRKISEQDRQTIQQMRPTHTVAAIRRHFGGKYTVGLIGWHCRGIDGPKVYAPIQDPAVTPLREHHYPEPYIHNAGYTSEWDRMTALERRCVR